MSRALGAKAAHAFRRVVMTPDEAHLAPLGRVTPCLCGSPCLGLRFIEWALSELLA